MGAWLTKLSAKQQALIPLVRDEWVGAGLRAEPADRKTAEDGVRDAYRAAGLEPPTMFVWLDSPLAGAIGATFLQRLLEQLSKRAQVGDQVGDQVGAQVWDQVWDQVGAQVWDQVWDQVWAQVGDQVRDQVWDQVRDQVWDQVRAQVGDQVGDQVWDQVWDQVRDQVWDQVGAQVRAQVGDQVGAQVGAQVRDQVWDQVRAQVGAQVGDQVWDQVRMSLWGQHNAGWLAWVDFWQRAGVRGAELGSGLISVGRSAGWWWVLRGAVVLTERPRYVRLDEAGRLHAEDGPAILYPDGFGVWAWHGLRVARELIEEPIQLEQVAEERNTELRRMMIERYGQDRYLMDAGARLVSKDHRGRLWRLDQPDDEPLVMVEMINSTPEPDGHHKTYFERVPPSVKTPLEALAWQADVPAELYDRIEVES